MTLCLTRLFRLDWRCCDGDDRHALQRLRQPQWTHRPKADALLAEVIGTNDPGVAVLRRKTARFFLKRATAWLTWNIILPISSQTIFRIGSITKQFTASAILKLQEEGKLSINDTLSNYNPLIFRAEYRSHPAPIVDSCTSGIHDSKGEHRTS